MIWPACYGWHHCTISGVLRNVNAYWNDRGWNFNANPIDYPNDWNADNRFVSRNYLCSPEVAFGSLLSMPFFQPPSILPLSSSSWASSEYFSVGISFNSHDVCKRNFRISSFDMQMSMPRVFFSTERNEARKMFSSNSTNCRSILYPMPYLSTRGKFL